MKTLTKKQQLQAEIKAVRENTKKLVKELSLKVGEETARERILWEHKIEEVRQANIEDAKLHPYAHINILCGFLPADVIGKSFLEEKLQANIAMTNALERVRKINDTIQAKLRSDNTYQEHLHNYPKNPHLNLTSGKSTYKWEKCAKKSVYQVDYNTGKVTKND